MSVRQELENLFGEFEKAWNAGDPKATGRTYVQDGALIDPFGGEARGMDAIVKKFTDHFEGPLRGTKTNVVVHHVREHGELASVDATQIVTPPAGSPMPEMRLHVFCTVAKHGGQWRFVDGRPYAFLPPPHA